MDVICKSTRDIIIITHLLSLILLTGLHAGVGFAEILQRIVPPRGTTGFRISSMAAKILESGILTFMNILVKLCIYPYIVNHVIWIALFCIQESLESSQESSGI